MKGELKQSPADHINLPARLHIKTKGSASQEIEINPFQVLFSFLDSALRLCILVIKSTQNIKGKASLRDHIPLKQTIKQVIGILDNPPLF